VMSVNPDANYGRIGPGYAEFDGVLLYPRVIAYTANFSFRVFTNPKPEITLA